MRLPLALVTTLMLAPGAVGAQQAEEGNDGVRAAVRRATTATIDSLFDAFRALDTDRTYRLYATGPSVLHISDGRIMAIDTMAALTRAGFAALASFQATWEPHNLLVLAPDVAVWTIRPTFVTIDTDGVQRTRTGVWTLVLRHFQEGWRIVGDHRRFDPS